MTFFIASLIKHWLIQTLRKKLNPPVILHPRRTSVNISVCVLLAWNILTEENKPERLRIAQGLASWWHSLALRRLFLSLLIWCCFYCISEPLESISHPVMSNSATMDCSPLGSSVHGILQARIQARSGLPCPSPGDLPDPGIKPGSPALQADFLSEPVNNHLLLQLS